MPVLTMIFSAAAVVLVVRYGLLQAVDIFSSAMNWGAKARGQLTGYATSVPEFVCLVAAGLNGVWEAGLWNIASSNLINCSLLIIAATSFRQMRNLLRRRFIDEVAFAGLAIMVPILLMYWGLDTQWYLVPILLAFFAIYRILDKRLNVPAKVEDSDTESRRGVAFGIILGATALISISVLGIFLGDATADVVEQLGVHPTFAGWILGGVTSIPEMVSFFAVYSVAGRSGDDTGLNAAQEALDNLAGSNMANVGMVYPLGLLAFLIGSMLLAG